ncbi:hypothetical protein [Microbacterium sp. 10M-3C3]|jgi:hypothetical protein|uniref:hypothetical protein n=1 Tax=Microbacterium sp. 10M-3C3 TaxID=2483401 RepID=UPI000F63B423|nr:hypothetical protein [Microbacterium sp. 10M-3C3]
MRADAVLGPAGDGFGAAQAAEFVEFEIGYDDVAELDRLASIHGGDRSAFLSEAIRVMGARERAVRLQMLQERIHAAIGGPRASEQVTADVRQVLKGT